MGTRIVCLGDLSTHGGVVVTDNQDDSVFIRRNINPASDASSGIPFGEVMFGGLGEEDYGYVEFPAVEDAEHDCPIAGHGVTKITAITYKSYINGKLILTYGAKAGCGAMIIPDDRKVYVE